MTRLRRPLAVAVAVLALLGGSRAPAVTLETAPGAGRVGVDVDGYGSFGLDVGGIGTGDAAYHPVGAPGESVTTTWESAVYVRRTGGGTFLTTGLVGTVGASGLLPDVLVVAPDATRATSTFVHAGLEFQLEQRLEDLVTDGARSGGMLVQTYTITNPGPEEARFDVVRYFEGELAFGGAAMGDGGGHVRGDVESVFQTDVAGQPPTAATAVAITAEGGAVPAAGRFEVGLWDVNGGLPGRIAAGEPLADAVFGDGPDADEEVDPGNEADLGLALASGFVLPSGTRATWVTTTRFGSGAPASAVTTTTTTSVITTTSTTSTLAPAAEVCGNCADDDGDGRTDYEDSDCCPQRALTLTAARLGGAGTTTTLRLRAHVPAAAGPGEAVVVQLRAEGGGRLLCARLPADRVAGRGRRRLVFRDPRGAVGEARGLRKVVLRATRDGTAVDVRGKGVALEGPVGDRLAVTIAVEAPGQARCATSVAALRSGRKRSLRFP
jgi:hypothetical protein